MGKSSPIAGRTRPFVFHSKPVCRSRRSGSGPVRPPGGGWGGLVDLYFVLLSFVCLYFVILYLVVCGFPRVGDPRVGNPRVGNPRVGNPRVGDPRVGNPRVANPRVANPRAVNPLAAPRQGEVKSHSRPDPPVRFPFQTAASVTAVGSRSHPAPWGVGGGLVDLFFVYLSFVCLYFVILYLVVCGFPFAVNPFAVNPSAVNPSAVNPFAVNPFAVNPFAENPFAENPFAENPFAENPFAENPSAVNPLAAPRQGEVDPHSRPDPPVRFPVQTAASVTAVGSRSRPAPWGGWGDWLIFTLSIFLLFVFTLLFFI